MDGGGGLERLMEVGARGEGGRGAGGGRALRGAGGAGAGSKLLRVLIKVNELNYLLVVVEYKLGFEDHF